MLRFKKCVLIRLWTSLWLTLSLYILPNSVIAQEFELDLLVKESTGPNSITLGIGVHPAASDTFDQDLDYKLPPRPPAGVFDARLTRTGMPDLRIDLRNNTITEKAFNVEYIASTTGGSIIVKWDTTGLSSKGTFFITDKVTGTLFGPLDMSTADSIDIGSQPLLSPGMRILVTPAINNAIAPDPGSRLEVQAFLLAYNYPNPFNGVTEISFSVARSGWLEMSIYNYLGEQVCSLFNGNFAPGNYKTSWDGKMDNGKQVASGVYYGILNGRDAVQSIKMLYIK